MNRFYDWITNTMFLSIGFRNLIFVSIALLLLAIWRSNTEFTLESSIMAVTCGVMWKICKWLEV